MNVIRKIRRSLRRQGVLKTAALCVKNLWPIKRDDSQSRFDLEYAVDTSGIVELGDLNINAPSDAWGNVYEPTPTFVFEQVLALLPLPEKYSFVDLGAGKGRIVLMAAKERFINVVGVEFSPELCAVAEANVIKFKPHVRAQNVSIVCGDAVQYEFPAGPLIVYFYHSFTKDILVGVLDRLSRRQDETIFVYYNVHYKELFTQFKILREETGLCIWKLT